MMAKQFSSIFQSEAPSKFVISLVLSHTPSLSLIPLTREQMLPYSIYYEKGLSLSLSLLHENTVPYFTLIFQRWWLEKKSLCPHHQHLSSLFLFHFSLSTLSLSFNSWFPNFSFSYVHCPSRDPFLILPLSHTLTLSFVRTLAFPGSDLEGVLPFFKNVQVGQDVSSMRMGFSILKFQVWLPLYVFL